VINTFDHHLTRKILDTHILAHVAFVQKTQEGEVQPIVIPMLYGRDGEIIYIHGSISSRLMKSLKEKIPISLSVTHLGISIRCDQFLKRWFRWTCFSEVSSVLFCF